MGSAPVDYERRRDLYLQRKYGITLEEYQRLLEVRGGGCWICGKLPKGKYPLHVDHDHKRGQVRGLLCWGCNKMLPRGMTPERLLSASNYLADNGLTIRLTLGREPNAPVR